MKRKNRAWAATAAAAGLALAATVAAVVASGHSSAPHAAPSPAHTLSVSCRSPSLGGALPAAVYLPAGYLNESSRYPVIYFLHGLPAGPSSYKTNAFVAQAVGASGHQAIVVAPQGARAQDSDREYLDWDPDENWPAAIAHDLTHCIDARFRTIKARSGRALIGLSAGGFGAFNIGLRRLATFAAVESWSGYFAATDPSGLVTLDLGSAKANRHARVPRGHHLQQRLTRRPTYIAFYVGSQDTRFLSANILLDRTFTANHIPHLFRVYSGGHSGSLWRKWAPLWLGYALAHLAPPTH